MMREGLATASQIQSLINCILPLYLITFLLLHIPHSLATIVYILYTFIASSLTAQLSDICSRHGVITNSHIHAEQADGSFVAELVKRHSHLPQSRPVSVNYILLFIHCTAN